MVRTPAAGFVYILSVPREYTNQISLQCISIHERSGAVDVPRDL